VVAVRDAVVGPRSTGIPVVVSAAGSAPIDSLATKVGEVLWASAPAFALPLVLALLAGIAPEFHACLFDQALQSNGHGVPLAWIFRPMIAPMSLLR